MSEAAAPVQRIVPGAPPPTALSKAQKKRRRAKGTKADGGDDNDTPAGPGSAAGDTAPDPSEARDGSVVPEATVAESTGSPLPEEEVLLKPSPIVELVHKRLKATTKKITRITGYASTDPDKLNDDQKRTLKTLPVLEAVQKELGEVKKAIEVHEAELVQELTAKRVEALKEEKARIHAAIEATQSNLLSKTSDLFNVLRARTHVANGFVDPASAFADDLERSAFFALADAVVGDDGERKEAAIRGFALGAGQFDGVAFTRLHEILNLILNPPRPATPAAEPLIDDRQQSVSVASNVDESEPIVIPHHNIVTGVPAGGFHFIQESEIDPALEEGAEWVEKPEEPDVAPVAEAADHQEAPVVNGTNGHAPEAGADGSTLDWAADHGENDLPPIEQLKLSGSATPAEVAEPVTPAPEATNGAPLKAEDGFSAPRGGRGGRGGRGYHRGPRGEPRGERGERREHRGGEHRGERREHHGGEHRGERRERPHHHHQHPEGAEGGEGGEHRGGRGGFRGGDRGGFRGGDRERGGFRGGFRGERGGDRGGFRGGRGNGEWRREGGEGGRGGRGRGRGGPGFQGGQRPATPQTNPAPAAA